MKNKIYIIHENDEWVEPLRNELNDLKVDFEEWHLGKRNIDHFESVKLDKKCIQKGISPPLLTAHQFMIDQEKSNNQSNLIDVNKMLVKFSILEGELNKVYLDATDPKSPDGEKITGLEKKKIFEAIKLIEDKILKIKLAIDKNK